MLQSRLQQLSSTGHFLTTMHSSATLLYLFGHHRYTSLTDLLADYRFFTIAGWSSQPDSHSHTLSLFSDTCLVLDWLGLTCSNNTLSFNNTNNIFGSHKYSQIFLPRETFKLGALGFLPLIMRHIESNQISFDLISKIAIYTSPPLMCLPIHIF